MKVGTNIFILFLTINLFLCKALAQETETQLVDISELGKNTFPEPVGIINDFGQIFTESQKTELSKLLFDYTMETTREVAVVTIQSIKPYNNIQKYATDLGNYWGVGTVENNNGLIIVVCKPCKKIGIATGLSTELHLTNDTCKNVIDKIIIPEFKKGNFYDGIKKGVVKLIEKWQ